MIEIDVFIEPRDGEVLLIGVEKSPVDWVQILHSSLNRNECVGLLEHRCISGSDANREPSLFALWIDSCGKVVVCVDLLKNIECKIVFLDCESFQEDDLEVAVVIVKLCVVVGR